MSEQIQSVLQQIQSKFQQSFSQTNLDDPLNKQLNPQSFKKNQENNQKNYNLNGKILFDLQQNEIKKQLKDNQIEAKEIQLKNTKTISKLKQQKVTPNFKSKQQISYDQIESIKRTISQNHLLRDEISQNQNNQTKPFHYSQLTLKLQKALNKISSDKIIGTFKHKNVQNIKNNMFNRFQQYEERKKRQIQRKKQQIIQNQVKSLRSIPSINSLSRSMVEQINQDPIYLRAEKIIAKKKQKQSQYQRIKQQKQEKEYEKYKQQYQTYMQQVKSKYKKQELRDSDQYYKDMQTWFKAKEKNIQAKKAHLQEQQKKQTPFKPLINSKSEKILLAKKTERRVPIYERQIKPKQQLVDKECTFKPKISKGNFYKKNFVYERV